ncbi:cytochrome c [Sphingobium aquiterrae]|uniref:c-type cytochrome n=1 Tax=Sphingobium aquiterrae TaxID=2038656 RepID=UPI00301B4D9C
MATARHRARFHVNGTRARSAAVALAAAMVLMAGTRTVFGQATPTALPALPAGPGHDLTIRVCSSCHAPEIAARQRLDHHGWQELIDVMAGRGAVASDEELAQITDYLSRSFPPAPAAASAPPPASSN